MKTILKKFQLALFPLTPFYPVNNDWGKLTSDIIKADGDFKDGAKLAVDAPGTIPPDLIIVNLNSKDGLKNIQIAPIKISLFIDAGTEVDKFDTKKAESYFKSILDIFKNDIDSWKRIGVIQTFFLETEKEVNSYIKENLFKSPKNSWSNISLEITDRDETKEIHINNVVKLSEGTLGVEGSEKNGLLGSIDVNNKPTEKLKLSNENIISLMEEYLSAANEENFKKILNIEEVNEKNR